MHYQPTVDILNRSPSSPREIAENLDFKSLDNYQINEDTLVTETLGDE